MSTVQEIERAIEKLSDEQVEEIRAWLFDRDISRHQEELKKTEADFAAGRIEVLDWAEAKKELRRRFE